MAVVITQCSTPISAAIEPSVISDHSLVLSAFFFGVSVELRANNMTVSKRDLKALDMESFRNDILSSTKVADPLNDVSELFDAYYQTLRSLVDKHVPAEMMVKRQPLSSPWFNHRCHVAKVVMRRLERRYRTTHHGDDLRLWRAQSDFPTCRLPGKIRVFLVEIIRQLSQLKIALEKDEQFHQLNDVDIDTALRE